MIVREKRFLAENLFRQKKGPFGPDGFRHPPPDRRIGLNRT